MKIWNPHSMNNLATKGWMVYWLPDQGKKQPFCDAHEVQERSVFSHMYSHAENYGQNVNRTANCEGEICL
jgi:hypothetical protein